MPNDFDSRGTDSRGDQPGHLRSKSTRTISSSLTWIRRARLEESYFSYNRDNYSITDLYCQISFISLYVYYRLPRKACVYWGLE